VPDARSEPNALPFDFFNTTSPRGVVFGAPASDLNDAAGVFRVSAAAATPTNVRFGNLDPTYDDLFTTFSSQRLFTVKNTTGNSTVLSIQFFIPGTRIPAAVSGFGAILADVDFADNAIMNLYDTKGQFLGFFSFTPFNTGLSFKGVSFNAGEKIARVEIIFGNKPLALGNVDGVGGVDVTAMDDLIYGEPHVTQFHPGDADGDGVADARIYRPNIGTWFTLNSGSNTVAIEQFGVNGDIPVDGDFDGDSRADVAVFRPSVGGWFVRRSSNNTFITTSFGTATDKPVAADYDKDGKTDIAFWRPANGNYFVLRSSDNQSSFFAFPFGQNGDIPVGAAQ
jgi:hypothetical protein